LIRPIRPTLKNSVIGIIEENFNHAKLEDVLPTTTLEQLGMDSLDVIELAMELEEEFDILIPDEYVESWGVIIQDVIDGIDALLNGRSLDLVNRKILYRMEKDIPQRWQDVGF